MRRFLFTVFLVFAASPAFAEMTVVPGVDELPIALASKPCDITISFGTMGPGRGIDDDTNMSMLAYLDGMTDALTYTKTSWGHEGQYNYCVSLSNENDSRAVYRQLKSLLPVEQLGTPPVMIKARHQQAKQVEPLSDPVPPLPDDRL